MEDRYAAMRQQLEAALTVVDEIQREAKALAMPTHTYMFVWENPAGTDQEGRATDISISARTPGEAWATFGTFVRDWQFQPQNVNLLNEEQRQEQRKRNREELAR